MKKDGRVSKNVVDIRYTFISEPSIQLSSQKEIALSDTALRVVDDYPALPIVATIFLITILLKLIVVNFKRRY